MVSFYYYTEDIENNAITKNEVSIDEVAFKSLFKTIKAYCDKYESLALNEPEYKLNVNRSWHWAQLMSLYIDIDKLIENEERKKFLEIYNKLASGTVKKCQELIKEIYLRESIKIIKNISDSTLNKSIDYVSINDQYKSFISTRDRIKSLSAFDAELEKYYKMVCDCISIKVVENVSIDDINRVKDFLGSSECSYYESDKVRKIGTFNGNK